MKIVENAECVIQSVKDNGGFGNRLVQMGVLPGSHLKIIRVGFGGSTVEVMIDQGQSIALRSKELEMLDCKLVAIPLSALSPGDDEKYRIKKFYGGQGFLKKMKDRSINISDIFEITDDHPFELKTGKGVIAVGRGEAEKIIVEPAD
jgi:Fe2+ transport system protein FeoA